MSHSFKLPAGDLKRLIDKTQFAISTEETRYYLNGIYLHAAGSAKAQTLRAVATDGHRLAQMELPLPKGADGMPVADICRKAGISQATYFNWKKKYDGLLPSEMRRLNGRIGRRASRGPGAWPA